MKISLSWLKRYVDIDVPVETLCDKMIMSGFEIEGLEDLSATMSNVVAAKIIKLEKHPDADKLQICQMDVGGDEPVQIVTGAQNVFEGAIVPAALHDSHLPNGVHIKKGKLRGVESNGMLCSGEELCLKEGDYPGAEVYGILILKDDVKVGTDMRDVLHLNDIVIDFKITANRPDCQSVLGVAREIAVALKTEFRKPEIAYTTVGGNIADYIKVTVDEPDICPRYMGRVVKNLRIGPSPDWMVDCLRAAGMRSINNIVDITNFVMLETGQPMHAFDLRDVKKNEIIVRRAKNGEEIVTLDDKAHALTDNMLVIADGEAPSCLAGIMGSAGSGIKDDTTELFFEAAKFRRDSVRKTARALGMRTESSARFEHGVDAGSIPYVLDRALSLIAELDCGDIVDGTIDKANTLTEKRVIKTTATDICALLGVEIPVEKMVDILNRLEIETVANGDELTCTVPSFRDDVEGRADLAEEVMRVYGYNHIIGTPMRGAVVRGTLLPERKKSDAIKRRLCEQGLSEISTYSFISSKALDTLGLPADDARRNEIHLLNPLGEEYSTMRTQLITSMLSVLSTNYNRKIPAARFFELSKRFVPKALPLTEQPDELPLLSIGLYGENEDFFTLKGVVESVFELFSCCPNYERACEPFLHPGRSANAILNGETVATFGELHPDTAKTYGFDGRVYVAEIKLESLFAAKQPIVLYKPLPRHPAVERDLALLCDAELPVATIEEAIKKGGGKLLESVALFDVYQGKQIENGKKSVAYNLMFRKADGTLTDEELEPVLDKIFRLLEKIGCSLRA